MPSPSNRPNRPSARPHVLALLLLWGLPAAVVWVGSVLVPDERPDVECGGLGVFCGMSPAEEIVFYGYVAAPVLIVLGLVALIVISVVQARRGRGDARVSSGPR